MKEETGPDIKDPLFCEVYHCGSDGIHNIIPLYRADIFTGTLKSSDEVPVFWVHLSKFKKMSLAEGMKHVISICCGEGKHECWMQKENGAYRGFLF